jgi:hypothetical protein
MDDLERCDNKAGPPFGHCPTGFDISTYEKYGINQGAEFKGRGVISIQFILTDARWKISSMAWDDERSELTLL